MTFTSFILTLFTDIIIISLAAKTRFYSDIMISIRTIMPQIIMAFTILFPLFTMSLLISICNAFYLNPVERPIIMQNVNKYFDGFKEFGQNLIIYSPMVLLVFCFIVQSEFEKIDEIIIEKTKKYLRKMNISIIFNYLALTILLIYIFLDIFCIKNNCPAKLLQYIQRVKLEEIISCLEDTVRMSLIIILGILYMYISIDQSFYRKDNEFS